MVANWHVLIVVGTYVALVSSFVQVFISRELVEGLGIDIVYHLAKLEKIFCEALGGIPEAYVPTNDGDVHKVRF